ncbi:spore coat U domain-containing protein [Ramlibacter sp. XY19]|uniref:spore coat protein U domain-containing protein n=1 Tax=Ramlibacter paludis TaxID=2908000 RepID=UPI0023DB3ABE|nr:spore coat U domain-containing protein [Ramlibacter paludis]
MPLGRFIAWGALLPLAAGAQLAAKPPTPCPAKPAECHATTPVYNFGRHEMTGATPPVLAESTVAVTCTRANGQGFTVDIRYELKAEPPDPGRSMRDRELSQLQYDLYVDAGRRQHWGDGKKGTKAFEGRIELNDANRAVTVTHQLYGTVHGQQVAEPGHWLGYVAARLEYTIRQCK